MTRGVLAVLLLATVTAAGAAPAPDCYDLGHAGRCPALGRHAPKCSGWRDDKGVCRHGIGGSGMGPRGMVGACGGGTCR